MSRFRCFCAASAVLPTRRKSFRARSGVRCCPKSDSSANIALGITSVPPNFLRHFVSQAVEHGMDIIRVFDSLNDMANLSVAIEACLAAGAVVEAAILYTGDMLDPACKYSLPYYLDLVDKLVATGAHVIAIKSMSGVWKPEAARRLVSEIRCRHRDIPIHVHTHDAAGMFVSSHLLHPSPWDK